MVPDQPSHQKDVRGCHQDGPEPEDAEGPAGADQLREQGGRAEQEGAPRRLHQHEVAVGKGPVDEPDRGPQVDADVRGAAQQVPGTAELEDVQRCRDHGAQGDDGRVLAAAEEAHRPDPLLGTLRRRRQGCPHSVRLPSHAADGALHP